MSEYGKERGFFEMFLITLVVAGLPLGIIWLLNDWNWFYFILIIAILAKYFQANQKSL